MERFYESSGFESDLTTFMRSAATTDRIGVGVSWLVGSYPLREVGWFLKLHGWSGIELKGWSNSFIEFSFRTEAERDRGEEVARGVVRRFFRVAVVGLGLLPEHLRELREYLGDP